MDAADSESYPLERFFTISANSLLTEGLHKFVTATLIQYWAISSSAEC
jgi:hypothetical protein